jgi:hypothetical protein
MSFEIVNDGVDANLTDKSQMSTGALVNFIYSHLPPAFDRLLLLRKDDFHELKDCVGELYYRHVIRPTTLKSQEGVNNESTNPS